MMEYRPPLGSLPGEWEPPELELGPKASAPEVRRVHRHGILIKGALSPRACELLMGAMQRSGCAAPVGVSGHPDGNSELGSVRATAWAPKLARVLWPYITVGVEPVRLMHDFTPTDWYALDGRLAHRRWRVVGLGPVLRFMRYERGGRHCAHYDAGFDYPDARRSLMSVVFYLSSVRPGDGGCTRIIDDGQSALPVWRRNHDDWVRAVSKDEVVAAVPPRAGDVFVFDHRLCHDVEPYSGLQSRIVIRADLVYRALDRGAPAV